MENLDHFREKLLKLKDEISSRVAAINKDIKHEGMSSDWTEQATERENDEVLDSLGNASEQELMMIKIALQRIDSGEYFICSICGADIPTSRLELLPFTSHCVNCADKLEH